VTFYRSIDSGFVSSPTDPLHLILLIKGPRVDVASVPAAVNAAREELERGC